MESKSIKEEVRWLPFYTYISYTRRECVWLSCERMNDGHE